MVCSERNFAKRRIRETARVNRLVNELSLKRSSQIEKDYDLTFIYWEPRDVDRSLYWGYPNRHKIVPLFQAFDLKVQVLITSEFSRTNFWEEIAKEVKANKILLALTIRELKEKGFENFLKKMETKELFLIPHDEEENDWYSLEGILGKNIKKILVTRETIKNRFLESGMKQEQIIVLPFLIENGKIFDKNESKKMLGIKTKYVLICWGYRRKVKGYQLPLEWIKDWKDTSLLYCGSVEMTPGHLSFDSKLRELVKKNGLSERVFFSEQNITDEDADVWFSAADLKIYPHQTFAASSISYAIGHGKCVITPMHAGFGEIVNGAGIVQTQGMKETVRNLLENPLEREGHELKSRKYAEIHNPYEYTKSLVNILELGGKTAPRIGILLATKNVEKQIATHLENWEKMYYPKERIKIYIMDGRSSDKTKELAKDFCKKQGIEFEIQDEPLYKHPTEGPGWIAETMNAFSPLLKDETWLVIVDADILYFPPTILVTLLQRNKDIIAGFVFVEPSSEWPQPSLIPATRSFADPTCFNKDNYYWGNDTPWKKERRLIEMDSVGCFLLVKREVFDQTSFDNPLPFLQFVKNAREKGFSCFALPEARAFHEFRTFGPLPIQGHVLAGRLPKTILEKIPIYKGNLTTEIQKTWEGTGRISESQEIIRTRRLMNFITIQKINDLSSFLDHFKLDDLKDCPLGQTKTDLLKLIQKEAPITYFGFGVFSGKILSLGWIRNTEGGKNIGVLGIEENAEEDHLEFLRKKSGGSQKNRTEFRIRREKTHEETLRPESTKILE